MCTSDKGNIQSTEGNLLLLLRFPFSHFSLPRLCGVVAFFSEPPERPYTRHKIVILKAQSYRSAQIFAQLAQLGKKIFAENYCMHRCMRQNCKSKKIRNKYFLSNF